MSSGTDPSSGIAPPVSTAQDAEAGSLSPTAAGSAVDAARPKRAVRPTVKALMAREQSPDSYVGFGRSGQPTRPVRTLSGARPQIKLKKKAGVGVAAAGAGQGSKTQPYMQAYDRELDSEDDETGPGLAFEEQLILRMPEGPECEALRQAIQKRQVGDDVWFKFKDSRRAVVHVGDSLFSAKLVDLPTVTESHKTLDSRQFFKIADIAQMLVVEEKIQDESQASSSNKAFNIDDFIYPHGITPPMKWARKRRFRKRTARRAIETVEKEVERLLKVDKKADQVEYELMDAAEDGGSEEEDGDEGTRNGSPGASAAETPMPAGSDAGSQDEGDDDDADQEGAARRYAAQEYDDGDEVDEDLAAELDAALEEEEDDEDGESARGAGSEAQSRGSDQEDLWDDDDEEDGEDGEEDGDEEDDENDIEKERRVREAQLEAECKEIEALVRRKQSDVDSTMNLIIKNRHQQALRKLTVERDMKRNQLADLKQARRERREAVAAAAAAAEAAQAANSDAADASQNDALPNEEPRLTFASTDTAADPQTEAEGFSSGTMAPPARPSIRTPASDPVAMDVDTTAAQTDDLWDDDEDT